MANAQVVSSETTVTLTLSALEAAVVYGIVGMTRVEGDNVIPVALAISRVRSALGNAGLPDRMTDFGARVGQTAIVVPFDNSDADREFVQGLLSK